MRITTAAIVILGILSILPLPSNSARAAINLVNETTAIFRWDPAQGDTNAYALYVSRNDEPFPAFPEALLLAEQQEFVIHAEPGDRVAIRVAALDAQFRRGPLSPESAVVCFPSNYHTRCGEEMDFDNDGKAELLWRHRFTNKVLITPTDGDELAPGNELNLTPDPEWELAGVADLDGDGHNDLLWENAQTKVLWFWSLRNLQLRRTAFLPHALPDGWKVATIHDFDADGMADIILHHNSGSILVLWRMAGETILSTSFIPFEPAFDILSAADHDGNGSAELLVRNTAEANGERWIFEHLTHTQSENFFPAQLGSHEVIASPRLNSDAQVDLITRHSTTGATVAWLLDGSTVLNAGTLADLDSDWKSSGFGDYDQDGIQDISWYNSNLNSFQIWYLNGIAAPEQITPASAQTLLNSLWEPLVPKP